MIEAKIETATILGSRFILIWSDFIVE